MAIFVTTITTVFSSRLNVTNEWCEHQSGSNGVFNYR